MMKKLIYLVFILSANFILAQNNPAKFKSGLQTKLITLDTLSTVQRDALTPKLGTLIYHKDTGISQHEKYNGTSWEEAFGGGGSSEWATYTGTRVGGDLVVKLGDYDSSANGTYIEVSDLLGRTSFWHSLEEVVRLDSSNGLDILTGFLKVHNGNIIIRDGSDSYDVSINPPSNATAARTYTLPNASGTIALTSDITSGGHTIQEDTTPLTARANLNFDHGLIATDDAGNDRTTVKLDTTNIQMFDALTRLSPSKWIGTQAQYDVDFPSGHGSREVWITDATPPSTSLIDLDDVNTSTATNRNVLIADGVDWESRALTGADISDFDTEVSNNASVTANTAKVTNATHTGEVTGSGALTLDSTAISNKTSDVALTGTEEVLINEAGTLKKTTTQAIADLGGGGSEIIFQCDFEFGAFESRYYASEAPQAEVQTNFHLTSADNLDTYANEAVGYGIHKTTTIKEISLIISTEFTEEYTVYLVKKAFPSGVETNTLLWTSANQVLTPDVPVYSRTTGLSISVTEGERIFIVTLRTATDQGAVATGVDVSIQLKD